MAFPWLGLLLGTALGAGKSAVGTSQRNRRVKGESERAKWAPWTGHKATVPEDVNWMGNLLSGGVTGATFQQQFQTPDASSGYQPGSMQIDTPNYLGKGALGVDTALNVKPPTIGMGGMGKSMAGGYPFRYLAEE